MSAAERRRARARERTVKAALDYFRANTPGTFKGRARALDRIRSAKVPMYEAKRLIGTFRPEAAGEPDDAPELADVQELRVQIVRRDGVVDRPHAMLLARMDRLIASDRMDAETFGRLSAALLSSPMECALPKTWLRAENALEGVRGTYPTGNAKNAPGGVGFLRVTEGLSVHPTPADRAEIGGRP